MEEDDDRDCPMMRFMNRRPLEGPPGTVLELEAAAEGTTSDFLPAIFFCFPYFPRFFFVVIRLLDE